MMRRLAHVLFLSGLLAAATAEAAMDPAAAGPHAVSVEEYNLGNTAFQPTGFPAPVEMAAAVFFPTSLSPQPSPFSNGFPLIVYLHGRHATCTSGGGLSLAWPCPAGTTPVKSYRGYDYTARQLAGHGYIVVSISANGISARDNQVADLGTDARTQLLNQHINLWKTFNTTGAAPFGTKFVGKVNTSSIGTMGHSRGGEGTAKHATVNYVRATALLAPTNFSRWLVNNSAVAQLLSYCDGDVADLQGVHYYDDARYQMTSTDGYHSYVTVMGGNHNFYNTQWTPGSGPHAADDWQAPQDPFCGTGAGNGRLSAAQQQSVALAYLAAFFRARLKNIFTEDWILSNYLEGSGGLPPTVSSLNLHVSYQPHDGQRRDVNRLAATADLSTNALGGAVQSTGLNPLGLCGGASQCLSSQTSARQPHTAASFRSSLPGLTQLRAGWVGAGAIFVNDIPEGTSRNVTRFKQLQFRAAVDFANASNPAGQPKDLSVTLEDAAGARQTLRVGSVARALFFPPGTVGPVPKLLHNTVRIPLASFTGIDKTRVRRVVLSFDQNSSGLLLVSDLHFSAGPPNWPRTLPTF